MKKVAFAILLAGLVSTILSYYLETQFHANSFWTAAAVCYIGLTIFPKNEVKE